MSNVDHAEIAKFEALAHRWWDRESEFKPLHDINPLRVNWINERASLAGKKVLDVGCGAGRMAIPLSDYLTLGRYFGIDIIEPSIEWCHTNITPTYNNFVFQHSNIFNRFYNPNGTILAKDYVFPFEDESFDFIFLTSVFTHMLPEDLEHYLSEISRVLKKGGVCFITYFLLNNESVELINQNASTQPYQFKVNDVCYSTDAQAPEASLSYDENYIRNLYQRNALNIRATYHGNWCNRPWFLSYQDIIIGQK